MESEADLSNASAAISETETGAEAPNDAKELGETSGGSIEIVSLPLGAPAKRFYQLMFHNHERVGGRKEGGGRDVIKVHAICRVCQKKVTGTDSYYLFKQHFQTAHAEAISLIADEDKKESWEDIGTAEEAAEAALLCNFVVQEDVDFLPLDRPEKDFFQMCYVGHEALPSTRRNGTPVFKYSGTCKKCGKKITGLGSVAMFKQHFKKAHPPPGHEDPEVPDGEKGQGGDGRSAKFFFETLFSGHEVYKEPKGIDETRGVTRFSGYCNICQKRVQGSDSYFNFRQHYYRSHDGTEVTNSTGEAIWIPKRTTPKTPATGDASGMDDEEGSGQKITPKQYFQSMFVDHACSRSDTEKGRIRKRYTAKCRECNKLVGGTDTFHNFHQHYLVYHKNVPFNSEHAVDVTHLLQGPIEGESMERKAKRLRKSYDQTLASRVNAEPPPQQQEFHIVLPDGMRHTESIAELEFMQQKLERNVALTMVESLVPPSTMNAGSFKRILSDLNVNPEIKWPEHEVFLHKQIGSFRDQVRRSIAFDCRQATAATVIIWSRGRLTSILARMLDDEWQVQTRVLTIKRNLQDGPMSSVVLLRLATTTINEFGLKDKVFFVQDCMRKRLTLFPTLPDCLLSDHVEDEDLKKNNKEVREKLMETYKVPITGFKIDWVENMLDKALENAMKRSMTLLKAVKKVLANTGRVPPISAESTIKWSRWSSVFAVVKDAKAKEWGTSRQFKLTNQEQNLMAEFSHICEIFEECLIKLEQFEQPTVCDVIPFIYGMQKWLGKNALGREGEGEDQEPKITHLKQFIADLLNDIDTNFADIYKDDLCICATFLHPKYKLVWLKDQGSAEREEEVIRMIVEQISDKNRKKGERVSSLLSYISSPSKDKETSEKDEGAESEVKTYLEGEDIVTEEMNENPLLYWQVNCAKYERLASLAKLILTVAVAPIDYNMFKIPTENASLLDTFGSDMESALFCHANRGLIL